MNIKEIQRKNDYLQKMLDVQIAYANELEVQMADKDESIKGYALHLEQVCEDLYNLKADKKDLEVKIKTKVDLAKDLVKRIEQLEAENKRLREAGSWLFDETMNDDETTCKCHQYEGIHDPETLCGMCAWRDALSKDSNE